MLRRVGRALLVVLAAYDGFEIGARVFVGNGVCAAHPAGSPVRELTDAARLTAALDALIDTVPRRHGAATAVAG